MSTAKGTNVTKFDAPGGDNIIPDGYVRTVEKVWLDDYTIAFTDTNCTLSIATLPKNKKVTDVVVMVETSASQTSGTVSLGFSTDASVDTLLPPHSITHNLTASTISLHQGVTGQDALAAFNNAGFQKVTAGTQVTVALKLNNWTMTTGTIKSIVKYT